MSTEARRRAWLTAATRKRAQQVLAGLCDVSPCKERPVAGRKKCRKHLDASCRWTTQWAGTEHGRQKRREYRARMRAKVLGGHQCACCGEPDIRFLTLDHIVPVGNKRGKWDAARLYEWVYKHGLPPTLQVLCYNCNCAKAESDHCPHEDDVRAILKAV